MTFVIYTNKTKKEFLFMQSAVPNTCARHWIIKSERRQINMKARSGGGR